MRIRQRLAKLEAQRQPVAPVWTAVGFYNAETGALVSPTEPEQQQRIRVWLPVKDADPTANPPPLPWRDDDSW